MMPYRPAIRLQRAAPRLRVLPNQRLNLQTSHFIPRQFKFLQNNSTVIPWAKEQEGINTYIVDFKPDTDAKTIATHLDKLRKLSPQTHVVEKVYKGNGDTVTAYIVSVDAAVRDVLRAMPEVEAIDPPIQVQPAPIMPRKSSAPMSLRVPNPESSHCFLCISSF
jgi:hypothetical protein